MAASPALRISNLEEAIERVYDLNVGVIGSGRERHERPHKPVLLLAVLDFIATGRASAERIMWSHDLRGYFGEYFKKVQRANDNNTPENPFLYLRGDGLWEPMEAAGGAERSLDRTPTAADASAERVYARFVNGFENCVRRRDQRARLRSAIVSRYFPAQRAELETLFAEGSEQEIPSVDSAPKIKEEPEESPGRNPAFRRKVREVYDSQCAACGLRIKLPDADLTFVDGAHLIPFHLSHNDHPTNGIALCKNHHWAMDRFLVVPTPAGSWRASPRLDARRSPGEQALSELNGQPILPPHDDAFRPDPKALQWRADRIYMG